MSKDAQALCDTGIFGQVREEQFKKVGLRDIEKYAPHNPKKKWNFPKIHTYDHMFNNIWEKGATRNYNTKPNESMHGLLKDLYQLWMNFKNVTGQIVNHFCLCTALIRACINQWEKEQAACKKKDDKRANKEALQLATNFEHVHLGLPQSSILFKDLKQSCSEDVVFRRFCLKLLDYLNTYFGHPDKVRMTAYADEKIQEFRLLKVHYKSTVTWRTETDILRCSPQFHGSPRYNGVIVNYGIKEIFAKLLPLCLCTINGKMWPLMYIQPLDVLIWTLKDRHLNLYRVCAKPRASCEVVLVRSVVHGVPIVNNPNVEGVPRGKSVVEGPDEVLACYEGSNHEPGSQDGWEEMMALMAHKHER
ncbi:hypothetical protein PHLCEN_2v5208 [Hermanssonia centrifuga]|uniref:Uncharacterized protein n=1 Tax=Hermanssonia centrifuga TaxID=98765 RepID=A0A2R6P8V3_9APHY|nr:hypothetical protein PHLCEN_2v5208 [Hermanssonia centrifuga]